METILSLPDFPQRNPLAHKGDFGHALLAAGAYGKMGAAVLSVKSALRSGAGLVTALIPDVGYDIMQISNPEAMVQIGGEKELTEFNDYSLFSAVGVGPGIGVSNDTTFFLEHLLSHCNAPLVLDADALNVLSLHPEFLKKISTSAILTPHIGEFKRLVGDWNTDEEKLDKQFELSYRFKVVVVLKGANTCVTTPDGTRYINTTGNAGMAKGGSGDVLTGIITALLAQGFSAAHSAILGVYVHGKAGDFAKEKLGQTAMNASDIIEFLPQAFKELESR